MDLLTNEEGSQLGPACGEMAAAARRIACPLRPGPTAVHQENLYITSYLGEDGKK
ncbi:hypothetical protein [Streptomyces sp. NPDC055299]